MERIDQIYCTHCKRQHAAFGEKYTARCGSLPTSDLKNVYFQVIDRLLIEKPFRAPVDTPSEVLATGDAHSLPARLVFLPSFQGYRLCGQVNYRQRDSTERRIGSYFAHFVFAKKTDSSPPWSTLDCLRTWQAPNWVRADRLDLQNPEPFEGFAECRDYLLAGVDSPLVNDEVLQDFVTLPSENADRFTDLDVRRFCAANPPQIRRTLLCWLLHGFLNLARDEGQSLLLVADPGAAALFFYGIMRLLPASGTDVSFSTYETELDGLRITLVATTFFDPTGRHRPESDHVGFWLNSFRQQHSSPPEVPLHPFSKLIVTTLVERGAEAAVQTVQHCEQLGIVDRTSLASFVRVHEATRFVLEQPEVALPSDVLGNPLAIEYLSLTATDFIGSETSEEQLLRLATGLHLGAILKSLVPVDTESGAALVAAKRIIPHLPETSLSELLFADLAIPFRVALLQRWIRDRGELPVSLLEGLTRGDAEADELVNAYLTGSSADSIVSTFAAAAGPGARALLNALLRRCSRRTCRVAVWRILTGPNKVDISTFYESPNKEAGAQAVAGQLLTDHVAVGVLNQVAKSANPLVVLWLLAAGKDGKALHAARLISERLPDDEVGQLATDNNFQAGFRAAMIADYVRRKGKVPAAVERDFFLNQSSVEGPAPTWEQIRRSVLQALEAHQIQELYTQARRMTGQVLAGSLLWVCDKLHQPGNKSANKQPFIALREIADRWMLTDVEALGLRFGALFVRWCPRPKLDETILHLLRRLYTTQAGEECRPYAALFRDYRDAFDDPVGGQRIEMWIRLSETVTALPDQANLRPGWQNDPRKELQPVARSFIRTLSPLFPDWMLAQRKDFAGGLLLEAPRGTSDSEWKIIRDAILSLLVFEGVQAEVAKLRKIKFEADAYTSESTNLGFSWPKFFVPAVHVTIRVNVLGKGDNPHYEKWEQQLKPREKVSLNLDTHFKIAGSDDFWKHFTLEIELQLDTDYWEMPLRSRRLKVKVKDLPRGTLTHLLLVDQHNCSQDSQQFISGLLSQSVTRPKTW